MKNIFNINSIYFLRFGFIFSAVFLLLSIHAQTFAMPGADFQAPKYEVIDSNNINLTSGQVTANINTVSIGGSTGLSHSISLHTNRFILSGNDAWIDNFSGSMQRVSYGNNIIIDGRLVTRPNNGQVHVMRVSAMGQSMDFKVMINGQWNYDAPVNSTSHTFKSIGNDPRHTLEAISGGHRWTQPDGTEVYFNGYANRTGYFTKIIYPDGFTINVTSSYGVTTNTGFQLKYHYVEDNSPPNTSPTGSNNIPVDARKDWSLSNPRYIYALNNAVEYCALSMSHCNFNYDWPKASFTLPIGMPRRMFEAQATIKVENAAGGITEFRYEPHDLTLEDPHDPSSRQIMSGINRGEWVWPRLVGIKPAGADQETFQYRYENEYQWQTHLGGTLPVLNGNTGRLISVKKNNVDSDGGYERSPEVTRQGVDAPLQYSGRQMRIIEGENPNTLRKIYKDADKTVTFEDNFRNFVTSIGDANGPNTSYYYGPRGNLTEIHYPTHEGQSVIQRAYYPSTCNNRKTCNQPEKTQDPDGNTTYFTYHGNSGNVRSITYPANEQGLIAQTRFEYQQQYAYVKNTNNQRVRTSTPIWLKIAERSCANSNFNGACQSNDEVITRYEYQHDNLLLTGMTVSANGKTLRTCYAYDIYGNQIGETQPNANLQSCP